MKTLCGAVCFGFAAIVSGAMQVGASSTPTISIHQPTAGSGVSPIPLTASVNVPVSVLQVYVDGAKSTEVVGPNSINASLHLPVGTHRITVQALDSHYRVLTYSVRKITVTAAPTAGGTTMTNLQEATEWKTCGNCGNSGGKGKVASYEMTRGITSPAIDNTSTAAKFSIGGPYRYANGYWWLSHTAPATNFKSLVYDFWLYVPAESAKAPQGIEFECQHVLNGYIHNFAWQADYASKSWRTFDYTNNKWIPTAIAFAGFTPDTWHHLVAEYHEVGNYTVHDALTVDGKRTVVNITRMGTHSGQTWPSFTNGFQLDLNGVPTSYSVYVDKMKVTYQ